MLKTANSIIFIRREYRRVYDSRIKIEEIQAINVEEIKTKILQQRYPIELI